MIKSVLLNTIHLSVSLFSFASLIGQNQATCFEIRGYEIWTSFYSYNEGETHESLITGKFTSKEECQERLNYYSNKTNNDRRKYDISYRYEKPCTPCDLSTNQANEFRDNVAIGSNGQTRNQLTRHQHLFDDLVHAQMIQNLDHLPRHVVLEDLECEKGNCHFTWKALNEDGSRRELNSEELETVQDYYKSVQDDVKRAQLDGSREELERQKKAELAADISNFFIEGLSSVSSSGDEKQLVIDSDGDGIDDTRVTINVNGKPSYERIQPDVIPDGYFLESEMQEDGSEIISYDNNADGVADTRIHFLTNGTHEVLFDISKPTENSLKSEVELSEDHLNTGTHSINTPLTSIVSEHSETASQTTYTPSRTTSESTPNTISQQKSSTTNVLIRSYKIEVTEDWANVRANHITPRSRWDELKKGVARQFRRFQIYTGFMDLSSDNPETKSRGILSLSSAASGFQTYSVLHDPIHTSIKNSLNVSGDQAESVLDNNYTEKGVMQLLMEMWYSMDR